MKQVVIAFDIDGTLRDNTITDKVVANERVRSLLIALASMKNTKIIVWSGSGEIYARQVSASLGIDKYVDQYSDKNYLGKSPDGRHMFDPELSPDIAVDDIQECVLGGINLIVREK